MHLARRGAPTITPVEPWRKSHEPNERRLVRSNDVSSWPGASAVSLQNAFSQWFEVESLARRRDRIGAGARGADHRLARGAPRELCNTTQTPALCKEANARTRRIALVALLSSFWDGGRTDSGLAPSSAPMSRSR
jgi:hypothetical protein